MSEIKYQTIGNITIIKDCVLEARNNPEKYKTFQYIENKNITQDICNLIKSCVKYELFFRYTNDNSKKQTIFIDIDNRVKLLTENNKKTKGNSIIQYSRLKYIIANSKNLSIKAIKQILHDKNRIKTIDIDHWDNNTLNNLLSNLKATPHIVNIDSNYDKLKRLIDDNKIYQARQLAKQIDREYYLIFLL